MKLGYWENPKKEGQQRIYINGLYPFQKGVILPKIWIEKAGEGILLNHRFKKNEPSVSFDINQAEVVFREKLLEGGLIKTQSDYISWADSLRFCEELGQITQDKARKDRVEGIELPLNNESQSPRCKESYRLDISSISFDGIRDVIVDHKESSEVVRLLRENPMLEVSVQPLNVGSFHIARDDGSSVVILRKSCDKQMFEGADFESSVLSVDNSIFNQSEKLKLETDVIPIVLIEGDVYERSERLLVQQVDEALGFLTSIQKISVLSSYNIVHTCYLVAKLAKHFTEGLGYSVPMRGNKPELLLESKRFVLEGIPGIDSGLAQSLIDYFGSVKAVANAEVEDLLMVSGMGPKKAISIYQALN